MDTKTALHVRSIGMKQAQRGKIPKDDQEDVAQETVLRVAKKLQAGPIKNINAYTNRVGFTIVQDYYRKEIIRNKYGKKLRGDEYIPAHKKFKYIADEAIAKNINYNTLKSRKYQERSKEIAHEQLEKGIVVSPQLLSRNKRRNLYNKLRTYKKNFHIKEVKKCIFTLEEKSYSADIYFRNKDNQIDSIFLEFTIQNKSIVITKEPKRHTLLKELTPQEAQKIQQQINTNNERKELYTPEQEQTVFNIVCQEILDDFKEQVLNL